MGNEYWQEFSTESMLINAQKALRDIPKNQNVNVAQNKCRNAASFLESALKGRKLISGEIKANPNSEELKDLKIFTEKDIRNSRFILNPDCSNEEIEGYISILKNPLTATYQNLTETRKYLNRIYQNFDF